MTRERPDRKIKRAKTEEIKENCRKKYAYMAKYRSNDEVRERFLRPAYGGKGGGKQNEIS